MLRRLTHTAYSSALRRPHRATYHEVHSGHTSDASRINPLILQETQISRKHLTPEIALRLITAECRLFHQPITLDAEQPFANDPFWGFYWPGGQAISRYILDNPAAVAGKSVLDVGSGCGASAVAALLSEANYVVANDTDEVAGYAALINGKLNGINSQLHVCIDNMIGRASVAEEVILLGDVFYDEEFAAVLLPWLQRLRQQGKHIFVGDPGRHGLTPRRLDAMRKIATYELTENCCIENNGFKIVNVWQLK